MYLVIIQYGRIHWTNKTWFLSFVYNVLIVLVKSICKYIFNYSIYFLYINSFNVIIIMVLTYLIPSLSLISWNNLCLFIFCVYVLITFLSVIVLHLLCDYNLIFLVIGIYLVILPFCHLLLMKLYLCRNGIFSIICSYTVWNIWYSVIDVLRCCLKYVFVYIIMSFNLCIFCDITW